MLDRNGDEEGPARRPPLSDEALETSRLLVEFLQAAYAIRHDAPDREGRSEPADGPPSGRHNGPRITNHAVRAAIFVYQHGERTVGQIAAGLGISYGWASRVVDELEAAHFLVRERDGQDRRIVHVRLDPAAVEHVEGAYRWHGEAVQAALDPLSPDGHDAVRLFLRRLIDTLNEGRPERP